MLRTIATSVLVLSLAACASMATYPPVDGKPTMSGSTPPLPQIMASSLRYAHQRGNPGAPLVFNLPPDTIRAAWADVERRLGDGARPMAEGDKDAFTVKQVRLNGGKAEVDVVYPTPEGVYQMLTVHLEGHYGGEYRPVFVQRWLVPVDQLERNEPVLGSLDEKPMVAAPAEEAPAGQPDAASGADGSDGNSGE
ncbi:MAG: hypothetical protein ACO32J_04975 [Phycisphaerales bacterium]